MWDSGPKIISIFFILLDENNGVSFFIILW